MGAYWGTQEYLFAINEALRIWQCMTGALQTSINVNLLGGVSASNWVDVPRQIVSVTRVLFNGVPLAPDTLTGLDYGEGSWQASQGTPVRWAPDGLTRIAIYPKPAQSGRLVLNGIMELSTLNVGDFVNVGNEELTDILEYCLHYLSIKEGPPEMDATSEGLKRLVTAATKRNGQLRKTNLFRRFAGQSSDAKGDRYDTDNQRQSIGAR